MPGNRLGFAMSVLQLCVTTCILIQDKATHLPLWPWSNSGWSGKLDFP